MTDLLSKEAVADIYTAVVHVEAQQDDDARLSAGFEVEQLLEQHGGYHGVMRRLIDMMRTNERELVQRREAAEKPVATVDIQSSRPEGLKFALVYSSAMHALPDDVYHLFTTVPLTSAEREILEKYVIDRDAENKSLLLTVGKLRVEREKLKEILAAYDRAAKDNKPLAWIVEPLFEPYSSRGRRNLIDGNIYDVDGGEFWAEGAREKHSVTPLYALSQMLVIPKGIHPSTAKLVVDFANALAEKLHKAELKYGYSHNWTNNGWMVECLSDFHKHIAKGDPRDVAAYCAFMWYHGWKTEAQPLPVVPDERQSTLLFDEWFKAIEAGDDENWKEPKYLSKEWNEYLARMQLARGAWNAAMLQSGGKS